MCKDKENGVGERYVEAEYHMGIMGKEEFHSALCVCWGLVVNNELRNQANPNRFDRTNMTCEVFGRRCKPSLQVGRTFVVLVNLVPA